MTGYAYSIAGCADTNTSGLKLCKTGLRQSRCMGTPALSCLAQLNTVLASGFGFVRRSAPSRGALRGVAQLCDGGDVLGVR